MLRTFYFIFFAFAAILFCSSSSAAPMGKKTAAVSAADVAKAEAEAKKASQEKARLEQQAKKIKEELNGVNQKMIAAAKKIQNGEDEVRQKQEELEKLQEHLNQSEIKFNSEHGMLVETLTALQSLALRPSEAVLAQPLSPVDLMRSSLLLRGSIHSLRERAEIIRQGIEDISNQKEEIAKRLKDLEKENKLLAEQQADMKKMSKQKSDMYAKISSQSKEAQQKATALANQAGSLRDLLDKLEKQRALQQKQMAEKQRLARERAADKVREDKGIIPESSAGAINFAKAKGRLSRPARGPILTKFHQEMSKGVVSNGIDIKTASNAQVIAPYDGTVIFAGPFKNFANLLIIDHGDGYTSLLSGLEETDAKVGQTLLAGEPVGNMPSGNNAKLHMEIRQNNRPLNPADWLTN
ncbi:MAG: peptidoglycan DD-metalloendopeptidase family protein [Alphaproteobacteria bacterium]|nr:peptidoglycan DD-metalloendopeptidase family protein [Alphaproteobacteria bacterium]